MSVVNGQEQYKKSLECCRFHLSLSCKADREEWIKTRGVDQNKGVVDGTGEEGGGGWSRFEKF